MVHLIFGLDVKVIVYIICTFIVLAFYFLGADHLLRNVESKSLLMLYGLLLAIPALVMMVPTILFLIGGQTLFVNFLNQAILTQF